MQPPPIVTQDSEQVSDTQAAVMAHNLEEQSLQADPIQQAGDATTPKRGAGDCTKDPKVMSEEI